MADFDAQRAKSPDCREGGLRKLEAAVRQVRCIGLLGGCGGSGESKKQMTTPYCGYCGRPVIGHAVYCGGLAYHTECTRGPGAQQYAPMPAMPGCTPVTPLTAEDVRRIVREELAKLTPNAELTGRASAACEGPR